MQNGENIETVAGIYGIHSDHLRKLNGLKKNQDPVSGSELSLKSHSRQVVAQANSSSSVKKEGKRKSLKDYTSYLFEEALVPIQP